MNEVAALSGVKASLMKVVSSTYRMTACSNPWDSLRCSYQEQLANSAELHLLSFERLRLVRRAPAPR